VFTVFHNHASDILRGSKQWWTLASKISRGIVADAYVNMSNIQHLCEVLGWLSGDEAEVSYEIGGGVLTGV